MTDIKVIKKDDTVYFNTVDFLVKFYDLEHVKYSFRLYHENNPKLLDFYRDILLCNGVERKAKKIEKVKFWYMIIYND